MDNVSKHQYTPPLFICPFVTLENVEEEFRWIQFGEPPSLPGLYDESSSLSLIPSFGKIKCDFCMKFVIKQYHSCRNCRKFSSGYHKECLSSISKHPYHPKHSLRIQDNWRKGISYMCSCCSNFGCYVYRCSICNFTMCEVCVTLPPLLEICHPKRHEHTLSFFPIKGSLICVVCGVSDDISLIYSCTQCGFIVHKHCVYLPWIIRISRHEHRLAFTSSLTPEKCFCGVCRGKIDTNYGRYVCVKGCMFGAHSKCALRNDVWDGKDLEGIEEDAYEDIKPFYEISDGVIQHFSHQNHHMKLDKETNRKFDENARCQACTLPIYDDIIYSCMSCGFILHQVCASLPKKKQHMTHYHPLTLEVFNKSSFSTCRACNRLTNKSFLYVCRDKLCPYYFSLDMCCASISEPFNYLCHPHALFLTVMCGTKQRCSICQSRKDICLNCGDCDFVLCFGCATLPTKLRYRHDEHFLILSYDRDTYGNYWCDVCEKEAYPNKGIYMCNECNVTVHIKCLQGEDEMYVVPRGETINYYGRDVNILPNNRLTRYICGNCSRRCKSKVVSVDHVLQTVVCFPRCENTFSD